MVFLIGTDEAGYGPNLGPLIITATVWRASDEVDPESLYDLLADCVCREPTCDDDLRLAIADSKQLYQPGGGLRLLERGVLTALRACGRRVTTWRGVWESIAGRDSMWFQSSPWHEGYDHDLPLECDHDDIEAAAQRFAEGLAKVDLELVAIRCTAVFPVEFNELVDRLGNKASLLSQCTLELVRCMLDPGCAGPTIVSCDKHGGRNNYQPLLQTHFPEFLVEVRQESRAVSTYRWGPKDRRVEFQFNAKGERMLTAALASMVSKYLRELAMRAFNAFWTRELPGLHPTAGYPLDSHRFKGDIESRQHALGIPDGILWRCR